MGLLRVCILPRVRGTVVGALLCAAPLAAQDSVRTTPPSTASRITARLLVVFKPPVRGVRRERALTRGSDGARALIPSPAVDTLIPQTLRDSPFVAVCAAGEPDSARLVVRVGDVLSATMIPLKSGLNRIALGDVHLPLHDGDVAEWSLRTRSGEIGRAHV